MPKNLGDMLSSILGMNAKQLSVLASVVVVSITSSFWIENRYAKLKQTQDSITKSQTEIIQLQKQLLIIVNALPENVRKEIVDRGTTMRILNGRNNLGDDRYIPQE